MGGVFERSSSCYCNSVLGAQYLKLRYLRFARGGSFVQSVPHACMLSREAVISSWFNTFPPEALQAAGLAFIEEIVEAALFRVPTHLASTPYWPGCANPRQRISRKNSSQLVLELLNGLFQAKRSLLLVGAGPYYSCPAFSSNRVLSR